MDPLNNHRQPGQTSTDALKPLLVVSVLFLILNTLFVLLRFISRNLVKKVDFGYDDLLIIPAWMCNVGICAIGLAYVHYETSPNIGAHEMITNPNRVVPILKIFFAFGNVAPPSFSLPKVSLLALYLRIFTTRLFRVLAYVLMGLIIGFWVAYSFSFSFSCKPANFFWRRGTGATNGHCLNIDHVFQTSLPVNVVLDLFLLVLPLPSIWTLKISRSRKAAFTVLFLSGVLALAASTARWIVSANRSVADLTPENTAALATVAIIEPGMYLITACLPALYPLLALFIPSALRNRMDATLNTARVKRRSRSVPGMVHRPTFTEQVTARPKNSFSRLVETDANSSARKGSPAERMGSPYPYEEGYRRAGGGTAQALPLGDMGGEDGRFVSDGIMVQTEIEVTQSDRVEKVLGI